MSEMIEALTMSEEDQAANLRRYKQFVARFQSCAKQTAKGLVDLIVTVADAQEELSPKVFERFCQEVQLPEDSKLRKWNKIGAKVDRFKPVIDRLPCNWTTLYRLALLSDEEFDLVQKDPLFGATMTAEDVKLIANGGKHREVKPMAKLAIDLSVLTEQEQEALREALKDLKERFGLTFRMLVGKSPADAAAAADGEARLKALIGDLEAESASAA